MRKLRIPMLVLALLLVVACNQSYITNTYNILSGMKDTYDVTMTISGSLYKQGILSESDKNETIKVGKIFVASYKTAVDALKVAKQTKDSKDAERSIVAIEAVSKALANFVRTLEPFITKGGS